MTSRAESATAKMAATLGHELRNPLAASIAGIEAVEGMTEPGDPRAAFLRRALEDLGRIGDLLDRYLELGCSQRLRKHPVDLRAMLAAIASRAAPRVKFMGGASAAAQISGDVALLERVFANLLDNAFQAGATTVSFHLRSEAEGAVVDVLDDGRGLPAELGDQIFAPFVSGRGGSGLGLAVVVDVIEAHGGTIVIVPAARGACFRICLPAVSGE